MLDFDAASDIIASGRRVAREKLAGWTVANPSP
jgi:hypothetical protein